MNNTEPPGCIPEDTTIRFTDVCLFIITLCLAVFIISSNTITVLAIWRTPALRTLANAYVCSLACADLVVGGVCVLLALYMLPALRVHWFDKSSHLCSLLNGLNIGMVVVSAFSMTLIAFDRYLYIIKPYFYQTHINIRVIALFITVAWLFGLVVAFLPQVIAKDYPACSTTDRLPVWYIFHLCTLLYILTSAVNIVLYAVILRVASRQRHAVMATMTRVQNPKLERSGKAGENPPTISKGTMKSIKFFLTVFGCFFCCITPMVVVLALDIYVTVPPDLYRSLNVVALLNSAMNFIIYAAMNRQFRQAFLKTRVVGRLYASFICCRPKGRTGDNYGDETSDGGRRDTNWETRLGNTRDQTGASVVSSPDP